MNDLIFSPIDKRQLILEIAGEVASRIIPQLQPVPQEYELIQIPDAMRLLGRSRTTINNWRREGFVNNVVLNEVFASEKEENRFIPVNPNTLYIECRQAGYRTSVGEINTFLCSDFIPKSNPFEEYFRNIQGKWNEAAHGDYIQNFSSYIQVYGQERFEVQFKKWLVRCVACCVEDGFFNKQALIIVQEQQNSGKNTLTRFLVPEKLIAYHAENISVGKDSLIALSQNFGIIQDELSTLSRAEINAQKTLMSKSQVKVRHPYDKKPKMEPRRASI